MLNFIIVKLERITISSAETLRVLWKAQLRSLRSLARPFSEEDLNQFSQVGIRMIISLFDFLKINALTNANTLK